jgi:hypothetical protein
MIGQNLHVKKNGDIVQMNGFGKIEDILWLNNWSKLGEISEGRNKN